MKLIRELTENVQFLVESDSENPSEKSYFIEGIFMQAEVRNGNGRIYPRNIMESEVQRYNKDFVTKRRSVGELGHPQGPGINEERISHIITELKIDGNDVYGKAKILDTPNGRIVKELMKENVLIGVSSRGVGAIRESRGLKEVSKFILSTVDIVANPSGPDCFVNAVMENVDWVFDEKNGWIAQEIAENIQKEVHKGKKLSEKEKLKLFENFIKSLV